MKYLNYPSLYFFIFYFLFFIFLFFLSFSFSLPLFFSLISSLSNRPPSDLSSAPPPDLRCVAASRSLHTPPAPPGPSPRLPPASSYHGRRRAPPPRGHRQPPTTAASTDVLHLGPTSRVPATVVSRPPPPREPCPGRPHLGAGLGKAEEPAGATIS